MPSFTTQLPQGNASLNYQLTVCVKIFNDFRSSNYFYSRITVNPPESNQSEMVTNGALATSFNFLSSINDIKFFMSSLVPILDEFINSGPGTAFA